MRLNLLVFGRFSRAIRREKTRKRRLPWLAAYALRLQQRKKHGQLLNESAFERIALHNTDCIYVTCAVECVCEKKPYILPSTTLNGSEAPEKTSNQASEQAKNIQNAIRKRCDMVTPSAITIVPSPNLCLNSFMLVAVKLELPVLFYQGAQLICISCLKRT